MESALASARHVVFRIILLAIGCGFAYVIGEALLARQLEQSPPPEPPEETLPQQAASSVYHSSPWHFPFANRSVDMQSVIEAFSWDFRTDARANSHGFRTPEYSIARPPDTFRVVVVGDSITWGQGVRLPETFAVLLEQHLQRTLEDRGVQAEVIAVGICGSRFSDNVIRLRSHVEQLEPDLVVFQFFPNDLDYLTSYRRPELLASLTEHSNLLQAIYAFTERNRFWEILEHCVDRASIEWRLFTDGLAELDRWRRETTTPAMIVAFPPFDWRADGGNFDGFTELEEFDAVLSPPHEAMEQNGLPVLDLQQTFRDKAGRTFLCVSEQDGHPNAYAHSLVAEAMLSFFETGGYLPGDAGDLRPAHSAWQAEKRLRDEAHERWSELNLDYEAQLPFFEALLELHPDNAWLVAQVAHLNHQMGRREQACELYRSLPDLEPVVASPWYHIALCTDDPEEGQDALEQMLQTVPDHAPAVEEVMKQHGYAGRTEQACAAAVELGKLARYPEQFARAHEFFETHECSGLGLDFWE